MAETAHRYCITLWYDCVQREYRAGFSINQPPQPLSDLIRQPGRHMLVWMHMAILPRHCAPDVLAWVQEAEEALRRPTDTGVFDTLLDRARALLRSGGASLPDWASRRALSAEAALEVVRLRDKGWTWKELADRFNAEIATVRRTYKAAKARMAR